MSESNIEEQQRPSQSALDNIGHGSMVKVIDPEKRVWYWVIIERRLEDHHFVGRIDAHCVMGPTLRHGGTIAFHKSNILYIWPRKVDASFGAGTKALKRATYPT
jgi:hypothetical protein